MRFVRNRRFTNDPSVARARAVCLTLQPLNCRRSGVPFLINYYCTLESRPGLQNAKEWSGQASPYSKGTHGKIIVRFDFEDSDFPRAAAAVDMGLG